MLADFSTQTVFFAILHWSHFSFRKTNSLIKAHVISGRSHLTRTNTKQDPYFVLAPLTLVPIGSVNGKCVFWVGVDGSVGLLIQFEAGSCVEVYAPI